MRVLYTPDVHGNFLSEEESHHVTHVLRYKKGDTLTGFDGSGTEYNLSISEITKKRVEVSVLSTYAVARPEFSLTLILSLFKPQRMEWAIEKGTEIGVTSFVFTATDFSQYALSLAEKKQTRFRNIAIAACKQSERSYLPYFKSIRFTEVSTGYTGFVGLRTHSYSFSEVTIPPTHATLLIGPEGGFSQSEITTLSSRFIPVTFGPHVQRAETAAITGSALLRAFR